MESIYKLEMLRNLKPTDKSYDVCKNIVLKRIKWLNQFADGINQPKHDQEELENNYDCTAVKDFLTLVQKQEFKVHDFYSLTKKFEPEVIFLCEQHEQHVFERAKMLHYLTDHFLDNENNKGVILSEGDRGKIDYSSLEVFSTHISYSCYEREGKRTFPAKSTAPYYVLELIKRKNILFIFNDNPETTKKAKEFHKEQNTLWDKIVVNKATAEEIKRHEETCYEWVQCFVERMDAYAKELLAHPGKPKLQLFGAVDYWFIDYLPALLEHKKIPFLCIVPNQMIEDRVISV